MAKNVRANIEFGLNIVIAIAVLAVAGVVIKRYLYPLPAEVGTAPVHINAGERLNIPNVDWAQNKKSLVFFLKKDCIYCKASAPFYRQLVAEAAKRNVKCIAILPNSIEEAKEYVKSLELPIENVQTVDVGLLSANKVSVTPTLMFVDEQGIVKNVIVGAAPQTKEKEIKDGLVALF